MEPEELRGLAVELAEEASRFLISMWCSELTEVVKGDTIRADLKAEEIIAERLRSRLKEYTLVSEESGRTGSGGYVFVVDPLDGSLNYEHCIPWSSVSVAIARPGSSRLSEVVAGAISQLGGPTLSFARGRGCYVNDERVSPRPHPRNVVFTYVESLEDAIRVARLFNSIKGLKLRSLGSAALEIAMVGLGRGLAYVDLRKKLRNVDAAAAIGLARECGARAVDASGNDVDVEISDVRPLGDLIVAHEGDLNLVLRALS